MAPSGAAAGRRLAVALVAGFVPAGVAGLALGDLIKDRMFGMWPTVAAWAVGGVVLLVRSQHERSGAPVGVHHGAGWPW